MTKSYENVPAPVANWLASLPSQNVGNLYARIKSPWWPFACEYRVNACGQLCDGRDHRDMVHLMLYNKFPNRGRGYTYVSWRAEPDNPAANIHPREGIVVDPVPYNGVAYDEMRARQGRG